MDSRFDNIRLVRIHYESTDLEPSIEVIAEEPLSPTGEFEFTDIGLDGIDTFIVEEFNELLLNPIPKTLDSKNNFLFLGNNEKELLKVDWSNLTVDVTPHVTPFVLDRKDRAERPFGYAFKASTDTYASPYNASKYVGYQRGERYRFGVVGFDDKLNPSFVHPINNDNGDIIFPNFGDSGDNFRWNITNQGDTANTNIQARVLHPKFNIAGIPDNVRYLQLVRVERDSVKRSVVDCGLAGCLSKSEDGEHYEFPGNMTIELRMLGLLSNRRYIEYVSPEILFNRQYSPEGNIIEHIGTESGDTSAQFRHIGEWFEDESTGGVFPDYTRIGMIRYNGYSRGRNDIERYNILDSVIYRHSVNLDNRVRVGQVDVEGRVKGFRLRGGLDNEDKFSLEVAEDANITKEAEGSRGTCMLIQLNRSVNSSENFKGNKNIALGALMRRRKNLDNNNRPKNFYGAFENSTFIPCSSLMQVVNGTVHDGETFSVFGGDTFINFFNYMRSMEHGDTFPGLVVSHSAVVETTVNTYLTTNPDFNSQFGTTKGLETAGAQNSGEVTSEGRRPTRRDQGDVDRNPDGTRVRRGQETSSVTGRRPRRRGSLPEGIVTFTPQTWNTATFRLMQENAGTYTFTFPFRKYIEKMFEDRLNDKSVEEWIEEVPSEAPNRAAQVEARQNLFFEAGKDKEVLNQPYNLYTYNGVYSRSNNIRLYFPKPENIIFKDTFNTRVYYTDKKANGEFVDSWTKVRPNNFLDVDSKYGDITRIINFRDTLYVFQENAVAVIPVEQRELVQSNTPGPLVAGTGDAVSAPFYFSTKSGLKDYDGVGVSRGGIYYFDRNNNKICRVGEQVEFLSDVLNIHSLLNKNKSKLKDDISINFNINQSEVLFNLHEGEGSLIFNEYKNLFVGNHETDIGQSFNIGRDLYGVNEGFIVRTDDGDYTDAKITLLLNPSANSVVLYDILELTYEILNANNEVLINEPVHSIKCWNEWQTTGEIILAETENFVQRFRTWRLNTLVDDTEEEARLRSSSLFVEIVFKSDSNNRIILHDLVTSIRPIKHQ